LIGKTSIDSNFEILLYFFLLFFLYLRYKDKKHARIGHKIRLQNLNNKRMDRKIIGTILVITSFIFFGGIFLLPRNSATLERKGSAQIEISHLSFDLKKIPYSGGIVTHPFKIKNIGKGNLEIANIATSCMCTQAYFKSGNIESPRFGMKGMSPPSSWKAALKPGQEGEIIAVFDPSYHGPQGKGPVERIISFETNDTNKPYVELSFRGIVE